MNKLLTNLPSLRCFRMFSRRMRFSRILFTSVVIVCVLGATSAEAKELRDLYLSVTSKAMGGTSVCVAEPSDAIWQNPALLARSPAKEVHYLDIAIEGSQDLYSAYSVNADAFKKPSISSFNSLMGYNNYLRGQITPNFVIPNFGISLISDGQFAFYGRNTTFPQVTLGYQNTNGIQMAFGMAFSPGRWGGTRVAHPELRVGAAVKALYRRGGFKKLSTVDLLNLTEGRGQISQIVGNYELGIGGDLGSQYVMPLSRAAEFSVGAVFLDIGDTSFSGKADAIDSNLAIGAGLKYTYGFFNTRIAYDYRNILEDVDWRQKNHIGLEFGIKRFNIQLGVNQVYITGGASVDIWFLRVTAATYAQELGTNVHQEANRRYSLRVDMKFNL